ncbi:MAG TPA: trypsin-like peptidase domain-containing protein [Streptosporangiaceae bacterium]
MTDDSRVPLGESGREDPARQASGGAHADPAEPAEQPEAPGEPAQRHDGFTPPDALDDETFVSTPAPPPPPGASAPPATTDQPPRPGFVPPNQPPYGWSPGRPAPYPGGGPGGQGGPGGPGGPGGQGGPGGPGGGPGGLGGHGAPPPPMSGQGGPGAPGGPGHPGGSGGFGTSGGFGGPTGTAPNWAPLPASPAPKRRMPGAGFLAVLGLVIALVAGALGAGIGVLATGNDNSGGGSVDLGGSTSASGNSSGAVNRPPTSVAGIAHRVLPSVVMIKIETNTGDSGAGSGFIIQGGYILTNNHVVAEAANGGAMQVVFSDEKTTSATVVGRDPSSDIAVIKPATTNGRPALPLGNSADIAVGDPVIAIGSPLGLSGTVTSGIVSALNRPVQTQDQTGGGDSAVLNAIQTDAAINPGNSGGPLVDSQGRVIGINSAIATLGGQGFGSGGQSGNIGVGFAIPINQVKRVAQQLINNGGKATHAIIGATMDLQFQGNGVRIASSTQNGTPPLVSGGPAQKAGLHPGDVITNFDGHPVTRPEELIALIRSHAPGDKVKLTYQRGGKSTTVQLTLAEAN